MIQSFKSREVYFLDRVTGLAPFVRDIECMQMLGVFAFCVQYNILFLEPKLKSGDRIQKSLVVRRGHVVRFNALSSYSVIVHA